MNLPYVFRDASLLELALTHRSWANENGGLPDNQRLEFLGDAVLQLVTTELLYDGLPDWEEGRLHRARTSIVRRETLAELADVWEIGPALRLGKGEERAGGRRNVAVLEDAFEALVAAVYLDGGLDAARAVLRPLLRPRVEALAGGPPENPRNTLQEWLEGQGKPAPVYREAGHEGPDHDRRFFATVEIDGVVYGPVEGRTKKEAFGAAATLALATLRATSA
ncbi:MAG: ribonuclease III [Myxococcota bacterium]